MSDDPLPKKPLFPIDQSKKRWLNFGEKNHENYLQYKVYLAKIYDKDEFILSPICINETYMNEHGTKNHIFHLFGTWKYRLFVSFFSIQEKMIFSQPEK